MFIHFLGMWSFGSTMFNQWFSEFNFSPCTILKTLKWNVFVTGFAIFCDLGTCLHVLRAFAIRCPRVFACGARPAIKRSALFICFFLKGCVLVQQRSLSCKLELHTDMFLTFEGMGICYQHVSKSMFKHVQTIYIYEDIADMHITVWMYMSRSFRV